MIPSEARARAEAALKEHSHYDSEYNRRCLADRCRPVNVDWPCPTAALAQDVIALCDKLDAVTKPGSRWDGT